MQQTIMASSVLRSADAQETNTNCALAELYTKSLATEQVLQEQKQAEGPSYMYARARYRL